MKEKIFICGCGSLEHQFVVRKDEEDGLVYFGIHLYTYLSFWQRLIAGVKYIFGYKCKYGNFDEVVLDEEKKQELINYLNE